MVIGENDALPGHELFGVQGATRLSDGRIAVANGNFSEVRYFTDTGEHVATAGRQGRGPEEFDRIASFARGAGDSIVVLSGDMALAVISPRAQIVNKIPLGWENFRFECRIAEGGVTVSSDLGLIIQAEENRGVAGCPPMPEGRYRGTDLLARLDPSNLELDTLGFFPGTERHGPRYAAFGRMLAVGVSSNRIFAAETGGDSIAVYSLDGAFQTTFRVPMQARPIPERVRTRQPEPQRLPSGEIVRSDPYVFEADYPRIGRLLPDRLGFLWVMAYPQLEEVIGSYRLKSTFASLVDPQGAQWVVLDPSGVVAAQVRTPPGFYVLEAGDNYLLGLMRNQLDVESVRLYTLAR